MVSIARLAACVIGEEWQYPFRWSSSDTAFRWPNGRRSPAATPDYIDGRLVQRLLDRVLLSRREIDIVLEAVGSG